MVSFSPRGPFEVPVYAGKNGRIIGSAQGAAFWKEHAPLALARGVYIFGMRSGGGTRPTYVGKATVNFEQEVFTHHKLSAHYNVTLVNYARGTPILFFLVAPAAAGKPNLSAIDQLETDMLAESIRVNPDGVTNERKRPPPPLWSIHGVVRSTQGKPSAGAIALRELLKL